MSDVSSYYVAHFASCTHELRIIESGYRAALVYNLCWTGTSTAIPPAPSQDSLAVATKLRELINAYLEGTMKAQYPQTGLRLVWLLEHNYTDKALKTHGHKALKGKDAFVFKQLMDTNEGQKQEDLFKIISAEAAKYENGECQSHNYGHGHGGCYMDESDVDNTDMELKNLISLSERKPEAESACCLFERLHMFDAEEDVVNYIDDESFWGESTPGECEGYTGNEGAPMSRWYSRRALVLFRKADERKISFLEDPDLQTRKLLKGIKRQKLTDDDKQCVLTSSTLTRSGFGPRVMCLAYKNADLDFVKQVVMKISETDKGFGASSERNQEDHFLKTLDETDEDEDESPLFSKERMEKLWARCERRRLKPKEDETGLTRCLKLYKSEGNIDDLEPYLLRMIRAPGERNRKLGPKDVSQYDWERAEECLRVADEILPTKDVYGGAIFELFFELMTHYYDLSYRSKESSRYEKVLKFLMTKYPDIIPAKWETMVKSRGLCQPAEAVPLIPFFQNSSLEMKHQIVEHMVSGVLDFVMPKWIEAQTPKLTSYGSYKSVHTYENEVQKLTMILATDKRLVQLVCEKFFANAGLDCVGNWIDWVFGQNIQQVMNSSHFKTAVIKRIKALRLRIDDPIPELGSQFKNKRTKAYQLASKKRNERIQKQNKLIGNINLLKGKLKSMG